MVWASYFLVLVGNIGVIHSKFSGQRLCSDEECKGTYLFPCITTLTGDACVGACVMNATLRFPVELNIKENYLPSVNHFYAQWTFPWYLLQLPITQKPLQSEDAMPGS